LNQAEKDQLGVMIRQAASRCPRKEAGLLPVLLSIQLQHGCISPEAELLVADALDIHPVKVREVVTFYTLLSREPRGTYHIQVCANLSCCLGGGKAILDHLEKKLGLEPGGKTADGQFSLETVECQGHCDEAPCMLVNSEYHGNLNPEKIDKILEDLS